MKTALFCCSMIAVLYVAILLFSFAKDFFLFLRDKKTILWSEYIPKDRTSIILTILALIGVGYMIASELLANTVIGSFWEKGNYTQNYEAVLYVGDKSVFCIAQVEKNSDEIGVSYTITELFLPYGRVAYPDEEYDLESKRNTISLGEWGHSCEIVLRSPASETSYNLLDSEIVAKSGEICASKLEDLYHSVKCRYAKNIKERNLVYFETTTEAEVFGFSVCDDCNRW